MHAAMLARRASTRMCGNEQTSARVDVQINRTSGGAMRRCHAVINCKVDRTESAVLVLGFGNVLLGDDGAGVQLVDRLRHAMPQPVYEFIDGGTMSFNLLPYVASAHSMLVVDAAELHAPAGTVELFEGIAMDDFLKSVRRRTVHEIGLIDLLDMARLLHCLPAQRALLCIQPRTIGWSETLSPEVSAGLPAGAALAGTLLRRWRSA